jgi:hypothetical protein
MKKDKNCKLCNKVLIGEMIFNPDLCFDCVLDNHIKTYGKNRRSLNRIDSKDVIGRETGKPIIEEL